MKSAFWGTVGRALMELFFPRHCSVCGKLLPDGVEAMCLSCLLRLPRTEYSRTRDNPLSMLFEAIVPFHPLLKYNTATAYFYYTPQAQYTNLIKDFKYHGQRRIGTQLAKRMAQEYDLPAFFGTPIDYIIPIPLHRRRIAQRGYNQSLYIAKGLQAAFPNAALLPQAIARIRHTRPQATLTKHERTENLTAAFRWNDGIVEMLFGKHILLIDDVITTGSTIRACTECLTSQLQNHAKASPSPISISVLSLGYAVH